MRSLGELRSDRCRAQAEMRGPQQPRFSADGVQARGQNRRTAPLWSPRKKETNMRVVKLTTVALILMTAQCLLAQAAPAPSSNQAAPPAVPVTLDQVIDRVIQREHEQVKALSQYAPISETYIQRMRRGPEDIYEPGGDEYFLGKLDLENGNFDDTLFTATQGNHNGMAKRHFWNVFRSSLQFNAAGFAYEIFPDQNELDRQHYAFTYIQREFLGEVRTLVFDVAPPKHAGQGRDVGPVWEEEQDF